MTEAPTGGLEPVAFRKSREHLPRLSKPYVPGRTDKRYWTEEEKAVLREYYPKGGAAACLAHLGPHRTPRTVYQQATKLGLKAPPQLGGGRKTPVEVPDDIDDRIREAWAQLSGRRKGETAELADSLGVPRWWLSKRAAKLGLTVTHRKEPPWTAAEEVLLRKVPLHSPEMCARIFREHGFRRSPIAIMVRARRLDLSRRATRETLSAGRAAKILGVDSHVVSAWCVKGDLRAARRDDRRLPQQGGSAWDIRPEDLRQFVIDNVAHIDIRKVDKVSFVDLLTSPPVPAAIEPVQICNEAPAADHATPTPAARRSRFRFDPDTTVGELERTFARAGVAFDYDDGPKQSRRPFKVAGKTMNIGRAIEQANLIRRREGKLPLAAPGGRG